MFYFKSVLTNISFLQLCSEDDSAHFPLDKFYGFFLVDHRFYEYFHKHSEIINVKMKLI